MKMLQNMKKRVAIVLVMAMVVCSLCACQDKNTSSNGEFYMGTITAIDGNTVTASVTASRFGGGNRPEGGERPEGFDASKMPEGFDPSQMPQGGEMPEGFDASKMPEGFDPSQMPERGGMPEGFTPGEMPEGFAGGEMPEGEEMVIEVGKKTAVYVNDEKASVSELKVGDFVMITVEGNQVTEIRVRMFSQEAK